MRLVRLPLSLPDLKVHEVSDRKTCKPRKPGPRAFLSMPLLELNGWLQKTDCCLSKHFVLND